MEERRDMEERPATEKHSKMEDGPAAEEDPARDEPPANEVRSALQEPAPLEASRAMEELGERPAMEEHLAKEHRPAIQGQSVLEEPAAGMLAGRPPFNSPLALDRPRESEVPRPKRTAKYTKSRRPNATATIDNDVILHPVDGTQTLRQKMQTALLPENFLEAGEIKSQLSSHKESSRVCLCVACAGCQCHRRLL